MSINSHPGQSGTRGFTLLELLIALSIFGLLSVMAYSGLNSVLTLRAHTDKAAEQLKALQQTYLVMQRDIEQVMPRPIRDEYGQTLKALVGDGRLELTRGGWSNPLQLTRSSMQRVGYVLEDRQLYRYSWRVLDRAQDSKAVRQLLMENIESFTLRYLDADRVWLLLWPPALSPSVFPKAVEVTIEHERFGPIKWLFRTPA